MIKKLGKKIWVALIAFVALLVIGGAIFWVISKRDNTPTQKVNDLKAQNEQIRESSGYNKCMDQVNATDAANKKCLADGLKANGYSDNIDCIQDSSNAICTTDRYNAQVNAGNDCMDKEDSKALTAFDCMKLLEAAQ